VRAPNLNALRMFDAAARHLNFRLAAEEMNLTQGAVAQQVRRLEADLGFSLFRRKARGLALTEVGRNYHVPVRRALAIIDDATRNLRPEATRITLSVTPSLASKWLVQRLGDFAGSNPEIEVKLEASEQLADFRSDGVDIAVRIGSPPFGRGLKFTLLAPLDLCAVSSPAYAAEVGGIGAIEDFAPHRLLQDGHRHWDGLLESVGAAPHRPVMQFNQTALAMEAAAHGRGIALAPRLLLGDDLAGGKLVELWQDSRETPEGYYVVFPNSRTANPARGTVVDWLLSQAKRGGTA